MTTTKQRELDAWIAENVMGYIPCCGDFWVNAVNPGKFNCKPKEATSWAFEYPGGVTVDRSGKTYCTTHAYQWQPTTDPAAAMEVLKRCIAETPDKKVEILQAGDEWFLQFKDDGIYERDNQSETLELAICLFAKKLCSK